MLTAANQQRLSKILAALKQKPKPSKNPFAAQASAFFTAMHNQLLMIDSTHSSQTEAVATDILNHSILRLKAFFSLYFALSAGKGYDYLQAPFDACNQQCLTVAKAIALDNEAVCEIIMPTVEVPQAELDKKSVKDVTESNGEFSPQYFYLSEHNNLIPVSDLINNACNDVQVLFKPSRVIEAEGTTFHGKYLLTENDLIGIRKITGFASQKLFDALKTLYIKKYTTTETKVADPDLQQNPSDFQKMLETLQKTLNNVNRQGIKNTLNEKHFDFSRKVMGVFLNDPNIFNQIKESAGVNLSVQMIQGFDYDNPESAYHSALANELIKLVTNYPELACLLTVGVLESFDLNANQLIQLLLIKKNAAEKITIISSVGALIDVLHYLPSSAHAATIEILGKDHLAKIAFDAHTINTLMSNIDASAQATLKGLLPEGVTEAPSAAITPDEKISAAVPSLTTKEENGQEEISTPSDIESVSVESLASAFPDITTEISTITTQEATAAPVDANEVISAVVPPLVMEEEQDQKETTTPSATTDVPSSTIEKQSPEDALSANPVNSDNAQTPADLDNTVAADTLQTNVTEDPSAGTLSNSVPICETEISAFNQLAPKFKHKALEIIKKAAIKQDDLIPIKIAKIFEKYANPGLFSLTWHTDSKRIAAFKMSVVLRNSSLKTDDFTACMDYIKTFLASSHINTTDNSTFSALIPCLNLVRPDAKSALGMALEDIQAEPSLWCPGRRSK